ncbi:hypothetical protein MMC17_000255 [Xylographa soralifera]|nr:hypothetical protein [Xylographa soralifera]
MSAKKRQKSLFGAIPLYHVEADSICENYNGPVHVPSKRQHNNSVAKVKEEVISDDEDEIIDKAFQAEVDTIIANMGQPYSAAKETPELAAFHPSFQMVERMCSEILGGAAWILQKSEYQHAETAKLLERMLRHQAIAYLKAKRIGLMGDSGVGKSTLINCLLDTPGLAHQGSNGAACTFVVTEYHAAWASQTKRFAAEIIFFEPAERETILKEYFADHYRFTLEDVDGLEEATRRDYELRRDTTMEAFLAIYAEYPEFQSEEAAQEFLDTATSDRDPMILDKLFTWSREVVASCEADNSVVERAADSAIELGGKIERFVKTWNGDDILSSPWPLVKLVKIGLHSVFLSRGVVLADLPGLSDVNQTRVKLTQLYTRDCDFIFLVARVGRVQTDSNTNDRLLYGVCRALGPRKALICTRADEMDEFTKPRDLAASPTDRQEHDQILRSWTSLSNEIKRFAASLAKLHGQARAEALDEIQLLKLKKKALHVMKLGVLIKMRNKKVIAAMQKKYESTTKEKNPLRVYCVSNEHYALHQIGYTEDLMPCSMDIVGISDVRLCALILPSAHKLKKLQEHCKGTVKSLISSLEGWCLQSTMERRVELRALVAKPREKTSSVIATFLSELKAHLRTIVIDGIVQSRPDWTSRGSKAAGGWAQYHHATYAAWCRNQGDYHKKVQGRTPWNATLLEPVMKDLYKFWTLFDTTAKDASARCLSSLNNLLDTVVVDIKGRIDFPGADLASIKSFNESLEAQKAVIYSRVSEIRTAVEDLSRNVKLDATTAEFNAYVPVAMKPVYRDCAAKTGTGRNKVQRALLENAISRGVPFQDIASKVEKAFEDFFETNRNTFTTKLEKIFDEILVDFDLRFRVQEVHDPSRDELRRQLHDFVVQAKIKIDGPMMEELDRAENDSIPTEGLLSG